MEQLTTGLSTMTLPTAILASFGFFSDPLASLRRPEFEVINIRKGSHKKQLNSRSNKQETDGTTHTTGLSKITLPTAILASFGFFSDPLASLHRPEFEVINFRKGAVKRTAKRAI